MCGKKNFLSTLWCCVLTGLMICAFSFSVYSQPLKESASYIYSSINRVGFIRKKPIAPFGFIFKVKGDKNMISSGDIIYIKPEGNSPLILGKYYMTYKTQKPVKAENINTEFGIQYYLTGVVEITKKEPRFAVARVTQSFRTININDMLMPYIERSPRIALTESAKELEGEIIGPEEPENLIGEHSIVFINKGKKEGVKPGQYYHIYYQEKARLDSRAKQATPLDIVDFGILLVLHAEDTTATALITRSEKQIVPGEKFHSP